MEYLFGSIQIRCVLPGLSKNWGEIMECIRRSNISSEANGSYTSSSLVQNFAGYGIVLFFHIRPGPPTGFDDDPDDLSQFFKKVFPKTSSGGWKDGVVLSFFPLA